MTLAEDLLEAAAWADAAGRRADANAADDPRFGGKSDGDMHRALAVRLRSHATAVAAQEAELASLRVRLGEAKRALESVGCPLTGGSHAARCGECIPCKALRTLETP